jgi:hypothetical protein
MEENQKGSITVFLSLILLLVVAVIMTTIESARVNVGKAYANRALALAMDSILAEYYAPLFQEYHVFGLEGSYGEESLQLDSIETKIQNSMEYTFKPNKDLYYMETYIPVENVNILDIKTTNLEIDNINTLLDYNGDFFTSQAVSYIKYKELGNVAEKFIDKISLIEETEQAQTVLNEKFKAEESIYKIDKDITKLMKLIDGITISEKGLDTGKSGIKIQNDFVKKLFVLPATSVNAGIYNPIVFYPLQNHFTNPISIINEIISDLDALSDNLKLIDEARITYKYLSLIDQSIFTEEEEFLQHQQELQNAYEALQNYIQIEQSLLKAASEKIDRLEKLMNGTLKAIEKAIPVTEDLIKKQAEITSEINKYEMVLDASRDQLNEDFYKGLLEDFQVMERYKSNPEKKGLEGYNFEGMKNTLITNQRVIGNAKSFLVSNISPTEEELLQTKYSFQNMKTAVLQYKYDYLVFDYTGLKEPEESEGFFKSIRNLVENGIIELVVEDMEGLSKKEIDSADLPSTILKIEESKDPDDIAKKYTDVNLESGIESLIDTYDSLDGAMGAGGIVEGIGELILFQEYLFEHFQHYDEKELKDALTSLDYELEYIIMGKKKDIDNLKAIIMRILLIRTIMNVISLMSDTKRNGDARLLAAAFVGFTGLPALVTIVKTLILFIWSFVESLVDVAALLGGKEIPLLKSKNDILVELHEIILTNKTFIKSKTDSIKENNSFLALNYKDYLRIFLFMESQRNKSFRAMDLIQVNLQFRYEDTFLMQNCLYSFRINGKFRMEEKFIALPFIRDLLDTGESAYSFKITKEYSY